MATYKVTYTTLAIALNAKRENPNLTLRELSDLSGIHANMLSYLRSGQYQTMFREILGERYDQAVEVLNTVGPYPKTKNMARKSRG